MKQQDSDQAKGQRSILGFLSRAPSRPSSQAPEPLQSCGAQDAVQQRAQPPPSPRPPLTAANRPQQTAAPPWPACGDRLQDTAAGEAATEPASSQHDAGRLQDEGQQQQQQQAEAVGRARICGTPSAPAASGGGTQLFAGAASCSNGGLTAYELERLERIRRNQEMLLSMGLGGPGIEKKGPAGAASNTRRPPRKRPAPADGAAAGAPAPVRRSARNRGLPADNGDGEDGAVAAGAAAEPAVEAQLQYDDSSVRRYVCQVLAAPSSVDGPSTAAGSSSPGLAAAAAAAAGDVPPEGARVCELRQLPGCLADPALARAYSVDWRPGLVVAGGKDGVVSVFGSRELEAGQLSPDALLPPLLSGRLHTGWVADVQVLSGGSSPSPEGSAALSDAPLLLTAGNDGAVCLWDLGRSAQAGGRHGDLVPECLMTRNDLHASGIFSLHEAGGRVLTASKDGTVVVSSLEGGGSGTASLAAVQRYTELHEGVIKCARWRTEGERGSVFGSAGNDRRICVFDTRQPPRSGPGLAIEGAHGSAINCFRWHPCNQDVLLTSSHDPAILLHDLRSPGQPLHRLLGHAQAPRVASIIQPAFVAGGAAVATGCERSTLLSLYSTSTGAALSRGDAGFTPGATFCTGGAWGDPLLVTAARSVYLFAPKWGAGAADGSS